jgi:hypothetical protein
MFRPMEEKPILQVVDAKRWIEPPQIVRRSLGLLSDNGSRARLQVVMESMPK